jgi:hypothetical protein
MWEVEVNCEQCEGRHIVHTTLEGQPRAFSFECPSTHELVDMRYRDPSLIARAWNEVSEASKGSVEAASAQVGGAFDI